MSETLGQCIDIGEDSSRRDVDSLSMHQLSRRASLNARRERRWLDPSGLNSDLQKPSTRFAEVVMAGRVGEAEVAASIKIFAMSVHEAASAM